MEEQLTLIQVFEAIYGRKVESVDVTKLNVFITFDSENEDYVALPNKSKELE